MPSSNSNSAKKKRSASRRSLLPYLILFIILLIASSVVLAYLISNHLKASEGIESVTLLSSKSGFTCDYSETQKIYPFADGVIKVTASRVSYLSVSGKEIYGQDIEMTNPFCVVSDGYAIVADTGGYFCALFNESGLVYQQQMTGAINYATVSSDGVAALIIERADTKGSVYLLSASGEFLAQWYSVESGYPVSVSFSPNHELLNIALADTDGSVMQSRLKQLLLPDETHSGISEYSLYSPTVSALLPSISYIGNDITVLAGISDLLCLKDGKITALSPTYTNIYSVLSTDSGVAVFYSDGVSQEIKMEIVDSSMTRGKSIVIGNSFVTATQGYEMIAVCCDQSIMIIDADSNEIIKTITVDDEVLRMGFLDKNAIIVVSENGVHKINL